MLSKTITIAIGILLLALLSPAADDSARPRNDLRPEQILKTLTPEIPEIGMVTPEDLEPNPQGAYRRYAFIRGDFNRDGIEDIAVAGTDQWQKQGAALTRNGYVLIASRTKDGLWTRRFFHKFPGTSKPFLIWDKDKTALLVGANASDADPGDIVWDRTKKQYKLVPVTYK
jgi:hypothetical protein